MAGLKYRGQTTLVLDAKRHKSCQTSDEYPAIGLLLALTDSGSLPQIPLKPPATNGALC